QFRAGIGNAKLVTYRRMPACKHKLGLPIERAQERSLPIVPDARPDRPDIANSENEQHFKTLESLHPAGEIRDRGAVAEISALRCIRHDKMVFDEPRHPLGFGPSEAETRAERSGDTDAGLGVVLYLSLGNIVQKERKEQRFPVADRG